MGCFDGSRTNLALQSAPHGFEDADRDYGFCCPQERDFGPRAGCQLCRGIGQLSGHGNLLELSMRALAQREVSLVDLDE